MKKISLKDFKNGLKREEMRTIVGGIRSRDYTCSCGGVTSGNIISGCTCVEFCSGGGNCIYG